MASNFWTSDSYASIALIRDAETEKFLHKIADPIFKAADLDPKNIRIFIVNDPSLNAFVSGGQNVFLNTGLIRKYATPDTLIGVIAHETGHIASGHLARSSEAIEQAGNAMILSYLLGIGALVAGAPDAGQALIFGGSDYAQRLYLKYNRGQEEAADQRAIEYLDKMSYPADGLVELLEVFDRQMVGYKGQIDEYLLSHPVSKKRISLIKNLTADKKFSDKKVNSKLQSDMDTVLAKLEGYMDNPEKTLQKYKHKHDRLSLYKKSIALSKQGKISESLKLLDKVIAKTDKNKHSQLGFLFELKGQILFESGKIFDSIVTYNKALKLLKGRDSSQARISFSAAILALSKDDKELIKLALKNLEESKKYENENPFLFKQLATAYSKKGNKGMSLLALSEFNLLIGKYDKCVKYAGSAKNELAKTDKISRLHADDLIQAAKKEKEKKKKK